MLLGIFRTQNFVGLLQKVNQIAIGPFILQDKRHMQESCKIMKENKGEDSFSGFRVMNLSACSSQSSELKAFLRFFHKVNQIAMGSCILQDNIHLQEFCKILQQNTWEDIFPGFRVMNLSACSSQSSELKVFLGFFHKVSQIAMGSCILQDNIHLQEFCKILQQNT